MMTADWGQQMKKKKKLNRFVSMQQYQNDALRLNNIYDFLIWKTKTNEGPSLVSLASLVSLVTLCTFYSSVKGHRNTQII